MSRSEIQIQCVMAGLFIGCHNRYVSPARRRNPHSMRHYERDFWISPYTYFKRYIQNQHNSAITHCTHTSDGWMVRESGTWWCALMVQFAPIASLNNDGTCYMVRWMDSECVFTCLLCDNLHSNVSTR